MGIRRFPTGQAGLEPAIYRLEGGGIIHYATDPSASSYRRRT